MEISGAPRQVAGFPDVLGAWPQSHASSEMHEPKGVREAAWKALAMI